MAELDLFATTALGMEPLLEAELRELGASKLRARPAGVAFRGELALAYRACLWSRVANRVLLPLARQKADSAESLYAGVRELDWSDHLTADDTLAVDFFSRRSGISHTHFGALKVKDAIVDQFRETTGIRPSVDTRRPGLRINVHVDRDWAVISLDLSGMSLHRRGYRMKAVAASLKETLAAAILLRADWPALAAAGGALIDPLCGAGTLPIEAALIAGRVAPGLQRDYFGFLAWRGHDPVLWDFLLTEARRIAASSKARIPAIWGFDHSSHAVSAARANVAQAGLQDVIRIEQAAVSDLPPTDRPERGLVVMNPPYGERLGEEEQLAELYTAIGAALKTHYAGWNAALFTGNPRLRIGLRPQRSFKLYNGTIPCELALFAVGSDSPTATRAGRAEPEQLDPGAADFANRLRKNLRHLGKWARRQNITCYRLYDADLPDYAFAVDLYQSRERWVHVQEYAPPASIDPERARQRREAALVVVAQVLELAAERIVFKTRERQRHRRQYQKLATTQRFLVVREGEAKYWVNLQDHIDTGLFLDHRQIRALVGSLSAGKSFLNLFAYTATASVAAILGGASASVGVDLSRTYGDWARRNYDLNEIRGDAHRLVRADCLEWIGRCSRRFDLILLDPPTFSNSTAMYGSFEVQRDHLDLLRAVGRLLSPRALLIFTTHARNFRPHEELDELFVVEPLKGEKLLPKDFARRPGFLGGWLLRPRAQSAAGDRRLPQGRNRPCV